MTATAASAMETALTWLREVVQLQPFGEVKVCVVLKGGNIIAIRKSIEEISNP